jgi:hypothetical protein
MTDELEESSLDLTKELFGHFPGEKKKTAEKYWGTLVPGLTLNSVKY